VADIILLATADWDHPIWTNKQHVACALADLGHRVLYVESLGLRPVRADVADSRRILARFRKGLRPPRQVRTGVWCWSPLVLPGARHPLAIGINRLLFRVGLGMARRWLGWQPALVWTYNPKTLAYYRSSSETKLVYHCVDDIQSQPDMDARDISKWEMQLCEASDVVFTTSPALYESRQCFNPNTFFFPNVADHEHFKRAMGEELEVPNDLQRIPSPRIGFVGAISQYKVDFGLMAEIISRRPDWSWVMIGPVGEGEGATDLSMFKGLDNVYFLGTRSYSSLPCYLKGLDVALLPLRKNSYTHSMFPMKFFEYLSAGLPVVATDIDCLRPYAQVASLVAPDPETFLAGIEAAVQASSDLVSRNARSSFASQFTYRRRTIEMLEHIPGVSQSVAC
jgi:glycosyltransferase involved in cell wall biosynthesis